ncbi:MAG: T9SS type A sorting domain-containing protein [Taibaiella sp.]|nr:T9SS type A sorting domain-containing protein [Taibaiella sp.]
MYKQLLHVTLLGGMLASMTPALAQTPSILPDIQLPAVPGPVLRPNNASSSTLQLVNGPSGQENLYIHSWDGPTTVGSNLGDFHSGIAWRRTDVNGTVLGEDFIFIKYADDIDAVIYEDGGAYYVLAAYYFDEYNPATKGHYYDIYKFDASGLVPVSMMNPLGFSPNFGRINVDATVYGLAITWSVPGVGIYAKTAELPGAVFGPDVLLPGTANMVDPDVCIRRGGGGSGTGLDLQLAFLVDTRDVLYEYRVPFYDILGGSSVGFVNEYVAGTGGGNKYSPPRIDCPDAWGGGQRWALTLGTYNYNYSTGAVTEWVYAVVKNEDWPGVPPLYTYPTIIDLNYVSYTASGFFIGNNPVIAYNNQQNEIVVGWMTMQNTAVAPGTSQYKYVAVDIKDDGSAAPAVIPGSFNMISNAPCDIMPVLAFSGQDVQSNYDGLHVAFSEYVPYAPFYNIKYKDRKWGLSTFKDNVKMPLVKELEISPNPFNNTLSFIAPGAGNYTISLTSIEGRVVYSKENELAAGQRFQVNTGDLAAGTYLVNVRSAEHNINKTEKMVKQ